MAPKQGECKIDRPHSRENVSCNRVAVKEAMRMHVNKNPLIETRGNEENENKCNRRRVETRPSHLLEAYRARRNTQQHLEAVLSSNSKIRLKS